MKSYEIPADLFDLALSCIARAEHEGAFNQCALPGIGRNVLSRLEKVRAMDRTPAKLETITVEFSVYADDLAVIQPTLLNRPSTAPLSDFCAIIQHAIYDAWDGPQLDGCFTIKGSSFTDAEKPDLCDPAPVPTPAPERDPFAFAEGINEYDQLCPDGRNAPFSVFIPSMQEYLPLEFSNYEEADRMARILCEIVEESRQ